jgi:hypothetical protein
MSTTSLRPQARRVSIASRDGGGRRVGLCGDGGVPPGGLGGLHPLGRAVVSVEVLLGIADDERLQPPGGDLVGPLVGFRLALLPRDLGLALGRQRPDDGVEQVTGASTVGRGDRIRLLPAERMELGGLQLALLVVGLVHGHDHRRRCAA